MRRGKGKAKSESSPPVFAKTKHHGKRIKYRFNGKKSLAFTDMKCRRVGIILWKVGKTGRIEFPRNHDLCGAVKARLVRDHNGAEVFLFPL